MLQTLKVIAALLTIGVGAWALIWPTRIVGFIGLEPTGPRGITELRAVLGGFFIALGAAPLLLGSPDTFRMLGIAYLVVAVVRTASMFLDKSVVTSNVVSIAFEIVLGVILVL